MSEDTQKEQNNKDTDQVSADQKDQDTDEVEEKAIDTPVENADAVKDTSTDSTVPEGYNLNGEDSGSEDVFETDGATDISEETPDVTPEEEDELPEFKPGDTVRVLYKIIEGEKVRTQPYEGIVIAKKGSGVSKTFTVRRIGVHGIGVERIFPLYSPNIESLTVVKRGKVRKSKLYYLRDKKGRAAMRVRERVAKPAKKS